MESRWFDDWGYSAFPLTILEMVTELKKITKDYKNKNLNNKEMEKIIKFYAETQPEKVFDKENAGELNITLQRMLGKKRIELIKYFLNI